jgi:hypothetical protein
LTLPIFEEEKNRENEVPHFEATDGHGIRKLRELARIGITAKNAKAKDLSSIAGHFPSEHPWRPWLENSPLYPRLKSSRLIYTPLQISKISNSFRFLLHR